ncbi:MAG: alpha/beta hydrolase [Nocardioides sp.]|nr:alpha/beta hydrolase [Nocardioides sp.]
MTLAPPAAGARDLVPPDGIARTIDSPEGPIYYLETGEGEPLVLCSAWGPQPGSTAWLLYRDALEILSRHRRCVVVELTNYGHTGPVTFHEPTHDVTVRAVVRVMDHLGIEKATCVGTSQGATTVLDLALQHPDRVEALVLGACHASTGGDPYLLANFPGETWRLHEESQADPHDRDKLVRLMRSLWFDESQVTDALIDDLLAFRADHMDHWEATARSVSVPHSNVSALSSLTVPTLVVHGRFDRMVPYEQALLFLANMPSADVLLLNECGHWPPMERPYEWATAVLDFLTRNTLKGLTA